MPGSQELTTKGIQFCLMVVGNGGTGRTTFVNTLCGKKVLQGKDADDASNAHLEEGVKIKPITVGKRSHFCQISAQQLLT